MSTYVVIHGAGDRGSHWDLVAVELRGRGHEVVAPDLPSEDESAGLGDYADVVVDAVGDSVELVVVAHSLGGFTAPLVCSRLPVDRLVLVAAMVPRPGEKGEDWWRNTGHRTAGDYDEMEMYFHDVPPEVAAEALERGRGQASRPLAEPWPLEAWPDVPTAYLLCRDDRFFPADWTRRMVRERLGIEAEEVDGGHCAYLSRPAELAQRLDALRR